MGQIPRLLPASGWCSTAMVHRQADGAQLVQPALDAFAEQLGPEQFDAVHERWVTWRQAQQPA